jgi:hypothetical protein
VYTLPPLLLLQLYTIDQQIAEVLCLLPSQSFGASPFEKKISNTLCLPHRESSMNFGGVEVIFFFSLLSVQLSNCALFNTIEANGI